MANHFNPHEYNCCCKVCAIPGPQGPTGPQGPEGAKGGDGPAGPQGIRGERGLQGLQGNAGPTGAQGVQGVQGVQGERGPQGATGPVASHIPFSISKYGANLTANEQGDPYMVAFSGFSPAYSSSAYLQEGEWDSGIIAVREGMPYPTSFVMTTDAILRKIYIVTSTYSYNHFEEGITIQPFMCLAISTSDELVYTILRETMVYTDPYAGGVEYPEHTIRKGALTNLSVPIPEGALVAIIAGIMSTGLEIEQSATLSFSGGLYLE